MTNHPSHPENRPSPDEAEGQDTAKLDDTQDAQETNQQINHELSPPLQMSWRERVAGGSTAVGTLAAIYELRNVMEHAPAHSHILAIGSFTLAAAGLIWARTRGKHESDPSSHED
jgi:hypothetical protein